MNEYSPGDLMWIPDGTPNYFYYMADEKVQYLNALKEPLIKGPVYGLALDISCLGELWHPEARLAALVGIQIKDKICVVQKKDVTKIEN
jgi:hypothetical protein